MSTPSRQQKSFKVSHSVIANRYRTDLWNRELWKAGLVKRKPLANLRDFLMEKVFKWFWHSLAHLFGTKHEFITYAPGENGCYPLKSRNSDEEITIAIAGDWATNTEESAEIATAMTSHNTDYTIHLGDTYYVGDEQEMIGNYTQDGAPWQRGPSGSFALMGNHEMYSMGRGYYDTLLKTLGTSDPSTKEYQGQRTSFFCLQTQHWLIVGLDTGYNAISFPFVWNSFRADSSLPRPLLDWLKNTIKLGDDQRGIIFLSHHQYVSGFKKSKSYPNVGKQLAEIIGENRKVLWLWGHEHRFAVYGKYKAPGGVTAYGRCIGHGGMPVELDKTKTDSKTAADSYLVGYDDRKRQTIDHDNPVGWNGYAVLKLKQEKLMISYHDINQKLLEETWIADGSGGMTGRVSIIPTQLKLYGEKWDLMVQ